MGCKPSSMAVNAKIPSLEKMYLDSRLPQPEVKDYKNTFEKEFF